MAAKARSIVWSAMLIALAASASATEGSSWRILHHEPFGVTRTLSARSGIIIMAQVLGNPQS